MTASPTLVTFLGKGVTGTAPGYKKATYRFPDGERESTSYIGLAMARWLRARRLIILGTSSSMWDVLIEDLAAKGDDEAVRLQLIEAVSKGVVDDALLARVQAIVERKLGHPCVLAVIPAGRDEREQQAILEILGRNVAQAQQIYVDVTHGFRHLAMLGLAAARYLRTTHQVEVAGLFYGALDMASMQPDGEVPVVRLDGLARIHDWAEAFARFDASGDYASFADLLVQGGLDRELANRLKRAYHYERTLNISAAASELLPLVETLEQALTGAAELFRIRLKRALEWARAKDLAEQQRKLALQALRRDDFLRAAILGMEAFLTRETSDRRLDPMRFKDRKATDEALRQELRDKHPAWKRGAYWLLRNVRNAMAHGMPPERHEHRQLLNNVDQLRRKLNETLDRLNTP